MSVKQKIVLIAGVLSFSAVAATEPPLFFIGAKGGYQWASDSNYEHSTPRQGVFGAYGGLQFTPAWSWELGYQYHSKLEANITSIHVKTWMIESALRYDWYLQDNLSLYGRLGAAYWDKKKTEASLDSLNAKGFSPLGAIGVSYKFTPNFRLSAGYQFVYGIGDSNTGQYDSSSAMISLAYTFGRKEQSIPVVTTPVIATVVDEFDFQEASLSDNMVQSLTEMTPIFSTQPQAKVVVVGHTDSTGTETYNQKLSEKRAQAVMNQLVDLGVEPERIESRGDGELNPVADNSTLEGRAKNRRVEITIPNPL